MPRSIPKPINGRRKPTAALRVSEPSKKELKEAPNGAIGRSGHGIAELAQELADLQALSIMMANAEGPAERARDEIDINAPERTKACKAVNHIEYVGHRAHAMVGALEKIILGLEPRSTSEALSLALVLADELEVFFSWHLKSPDIQIDNARRNLEDALWAIVRGLVGTGATSPLLRHYTGRDDLVTWAEACSTAKREAAPYLVANTEEDCQ